MKRKLLLAGIVALLIPFVFSMPVFTADDVTITGTVEAMAIDDNDNITAVTIETNDGPYDVINNATGKKLLKLVGKDVKVTGILGEDSMGNRTITVRTYEILTE